MKVLKGISIGMLFSACQLVNADCSSSLTLSNVPLFFYSHSIGTYTIKLKPTMNAIESGDDESGFRIMKNHGAVLAQVD